mmetsp:Transcript_110578/g.309081  ORF Transcript_110578/g.309081 Transcript_110578/m.309081 type:complete len:242 (-) Transcript_110578:13-738(-)
MVDLDFLVVGRCGQLKVGVVDFVLDVDLLVVGRGGEPDIGVAIVVSEDDIGFFGFHVVSGVDGDASAIQVKSLGGFDASDVEASTGRSGETKRKISIFIVGIELEIGRAAILTINIGTCRNSPSSDLGAGLAPNVSRKRGNIGGGADGRFNTVVKIDITRRRRSAPIDGRVESIKAIEVSIADGNRKLRAASSGDTNDRGKGKSREFHCWNDCEKLWMTMMTRPKNCEKATNRQVRVTSPK